MVASEDVDGVLFTGSYEVGLKIKQETMNHYWKILALEMGGKNATVVWEDADMDKAIYESLIGAYLTTGQRCSCTSRIILHDKIADEFTDRFYQAAKKLTIGHWSENPFMGSLINASAVEKYVRFQEIANPRKLRKHHARQSPRSETQGSLRDAEYPPREEVRSRVGLPGRAKSSARTWRSTDRPTSTRTLKIVNSTGFGLVMALFSKSRELYEKALLEARVGVLNFNRTTNGASSRLPFGGMGKSGNDRSSANFAIQYCTVPVASLETRRRLSATVCFRNHLRGQMKTLIKATAVVIFLVLCVGAAAGFYAWISRTGGRGRFPRGDLRNCSGQEIRGDREGTRIRRRREFGELFNLYARFPASAPG